MQNKESKKESLLNCPFCGVELHKHHRYYHHEINGCLFDDYEFFEEDFEKWNTRKPMQEIVERLEEILDGLSDGGDDWFTADQINKAIEIVKEVGGMNE